MNFYNANLLQKIWWIQKKVVTLQSKSKKSIGV